MEKKNKAKNAKIVRAARSQLEKLVRSLVHFSRVILFIAQQLSTRSRLLDEARGELYVALYLHYAYMPIKNRGLPVCRARLTQDYLTGYAQELDEIRTVRMVMVQRQEALSVRRAPPISDSCIVSLLDCSLVPST